MIELIAAMTTNGCIGDDNQLPWKNMKDDMKFFRETTTGKAIIMGRNTFESIGSKPLPKRVNIVISSTLEPSEGIEVADSLQEAIELAHKHDKVPIIIGGGRVYSEAINIVDVMYLTVVDVEKNGDTNFPHVPFWQYNQTVVGKGEKDERNDYSYTIHKLIKK